MPILGTVNNDTPPGTMGDDLFQMGQGGNDVIAALGGNDTIDMGAAMTSADRINGGAGSDTVILNGNYAGGLALAAASMVNVETLEVKGGFSYNLTMHDGNVAAGKQMTVTAWTLGGANSLRFDGAAETDGSFLVYDGAGGDSIVGGKGGDYFVMAYGGADTVRGGEGGDVLSFGAGFGAGDVADGGAGADVVYLTGAYAAPVVLTGGNLIDVETVNAYGANKITFSVQDSTLSAGQWLNFDFRGADVGMTVLGSPETDGRFDFYDGKGDDQLIGGGGDDLFRMGKGGDDYLSGGGGGDSFYMGASLTAGDVIYGGAGYDWIDLDGDYGAGVTFAGDGLAGVERFTLRGDFTYKLIFADDNVQAGESMLIGGGGRVHLDASAETSSAYIMYDTAGNDTLIGGGGADNFWLSAGQDQVAGGGGGDAILFHKPPVGAATIDGGAGGDIFYLGGVGQGASLDLVAGTLTVGADYTATVISVESAYGSAFADTLTGGTGSNFFSAGDGNDHLRGGAGGDILDGGNGFDRAFYAGSSAGVTVNLATGKGSGGDAQGDTLSNIEAVVGSAFGDVLTGNGAANALVGGGGADTLRGGAGADTLTGGLGADSFVFGTLAESPPAAADIIADFSHAQGDRILLGGIDANHTVAGNQAFAFIGDAAFSAAGQLRFAGGQLQGDVNGDGTADLVIKLAGVTSLVAADIVL